MTLQILGIMSIIFNHHFPLLGKISLKPQGSLNNPLFYFDFSSVQINMNFLVTGDGNWWKKAVFGLVKRTAGTKSLSLLCSSVVCSVQCAKAVVGRVCVSGGNTEVIPAPAGSLRDPSVAAGFEAFIPFLRNFCCNMLLDSFRFSFSEYLLMLSV